MSESGKESPADNRLIVPNVTDSASPRIEFRRPPCEACGSVPAWDTLFGWLCTGCVNAFRAAAHQLIREHRRTEEANHAHDG